MTLARVSYVNLLRSAGGGCIPHSTLDPPLLFNIGDAEYTVIRSRHYSKRIRPMLEYNTIQCNNNICRALFTKRPGALTETSDDMLCEIVQSLNGA